MKPHLLLLSLLAATAAIPASSGPAALVAVGTSARVEAHGGEAGRRLSPAELARLREQVRQQWAASPELVHSAESRPAERMMPEEPRKLESVSPRGKRP